VRFGPFKKKDGHHLPNSDILQNFGNGCHAIVGVLISAI
jgi:hypothetical protein